MAETLTRSSSNGENPGVSEEATASHPANTLQDHLTMARRASSALSERRLQEIAARHGQLSAVDAPPVLEWLSTTRLQAQTVGFVFENDGPVQIGPMMMASPKPKPAAKPSITQKVPVRKPEPKKAPDAPTPREAEGLSFRPNRVPLSRGKAFHTDPIPASALRIHMPALWQNPLHPSMMLGPSPEAEKAAAEARRAQPDLSVPEPDMLDPDVEFLIGQAPTEQTSAKTETKASREGRKGKRRHDAEAKAAAQERAALEKAEKAAQEKVALERAAETAPAAGQAAEPVAQTEAAAPPVASESKLVFAPPPQQQLSFVSTSLLSIEAEQPVEEDQTPITLPNILFVDQQPIVQHWFVRLPVIAKMALVIVVLAVIGGIGMIINSGLKEEQQQAAKAQAKLPPFEVGAPIVGDTGWQPDYVTDATGVRRRQLAFFRASTGLTDYRVEFLGEIEYKALAWVVRAMDNKNFYSMKLYVSKPGAEPVVTFQRFAVVHSKEGEKVEKPLPFKVALDTVYRVRIDAFNNKITTRIQGEVVDEWTDNQVIGGAFGTSNEMGERGQIRNVQMWNLRARAK